MESRPEGKRAKERQGKIIWTYTRRGDSKKK